MTPFSQWPEWSQALVRALIVVVPILTLVPGFIWWERRLLSWMQDRIGPNRVGPKGLLQPIADGVKLFLKEDITPDAIDRVIYFIAPALALFPAFAIGATVPWGPDVLLTPVADVNIGVLYVLAISSLGVYGIVLAGYSSSNKYSLLGGLRSSAQLISYELAMGMAVAAIVLGTGSLKMTDMVKAQSGPLFGIPWLGFLSNWNIFSPTGFVAAVIFLICMMAETNRVPFDLPEAENELIAGYHTEYSSMKFAVFFMGEYAAMFMFSCVFTALFLGGYTLPFPINWPGEWWVNLIAAGIFIGKALFFVTFYIWARATLPRFRYDQLMSLGWKSLLPLGVFNFVVVACREIVIPLKGNVAGLAIEVLSFIALAMVMQSYKRAVPDIRLEDRSIRLADGGSSQISPSKPAKKVKEKATV